MYCLVFRVILSLALTIALVTSVSAPIACAEAIGEAVRGNLENDILYYITVDRFVDGDPGNNIPNYAFPLDSELEELSLAYNQTNRAVLPYMYDPTHRYINLYWGGDLDGIVQKLDYLKDLGITKLVLSPIQDTENGLLYRPRSKGYLHETADPKNESYSQFYAQATAGFNEAWNIDWFEIDEHWRSSHEFETDRFSTFRRLLDEAGNRGIGIILALNLNHGSPYRESASYDGFSLDRGDRWLVDNGAIYRHGEKQADNINLASGDHNPQGWFHEPVAVDYTRPNQRMLEDGPIGGFPDLNHENPAVTSYLLDAARFWLSLNPDGHQVAGFYCNFLANIPTQFWQEFEQAVLQTNPEAILIGEFDFGGYRNPKSIDWYSETSHHAMVNYDLSISARRFFGRERHWDGRSEVMRESILGKDGRYYNYSPFNKVFHHILNPSQVLEVPRSSLDRVDTADVKAWITFVENHDQNRLMSDHPELSDRAYASNIKFIFSSMGTPMLMYGVETGLAVPYHLDHSAPSGIGGDPFNQQMMIWPGDNGWNDGLYQVTRTMVHLRQSHPMLRYGTSRFIFPKGSARDSDFFMVRESQTCARMESNECDRLLYIYSTFGGTFLIAANDLPLGRYQDVETGALVSMTDAGLALALEPEESKVLLLVQ